MITFRHVQSFFRVDKKKLVVFNRLNFSIPEYGITLIRGDSGVGKSTLLLLLSGQLKPNRGRVHHHNLNDEDIRMLSHEFHFFPTWTIEDYRTIFSIDDETFNTLNLNYLKINTRLSSLSGGEKLRLFLLILIVQKPKLLLLDEPTHALDDENVTRFIKMIATYPNKVIIATHDRRLDTLANQWIDLKDAYSYEITSMGHPVPLKKVHSNAFKLNKSKVKKNIIHYVFQQHRIGFVFRFFEFQLLLGIALLSVGNVSLNHYRNDLKQDPLAFRVSYVTKMTKESIPNSPFNLIRYNQPTHEEVRQLLTNFDSIVIDDDYSKMLPKTIRIQHRLYQVRLTEFDHLGDNLDVFVVDIDNGFDLSSLTFHFSIEDSDSFEPMQVSFERLIQVKGHRIIKTTLEEPTLYFSYRQIRKIAEETQLNHSTFLNVADYIRSQNNDFKLLIFKDGFQFFTIHQALDNHETFTLISDGFRTFDNQSQWMFLLDVGSLFLLALSVGIFMLFQLLVQNHSKERALNLFKMLVPLGVPKPWMKHLFFTRVLSSNLITSSVVLLSILSVYQNYGYRFIDLLFYLWITGFIVLIYLVVTTMNLRYQRW